MKISLFLNSTLTKSCVQSQSKDWFQQEQKRHMHHTQDNKRLISYGGSSSKPSINCFQSRSTPVNRIRQFPAFLNACYELQWLINSRTTLSQVLDTAVKQIHSLSSLLLLYLTLVLLLAQVAGLALILSCAVTLPFGLQFMLGSVIFIAVIAFKIMY